MMKNSTLKLGLLPVLVLSSWAALAQEAVNLDNITMTVVDDGAFEARQLGRPDTDSIRKSMQGNRGNRPAGFPEPSAEMTANFEALRAAIESGDQEAIDAAREQAGLPELTAEMQANFEALRAAIESGDQEAIDALREQMQTLRGERGRARPDGFPVEIDQAQLEELRALIESGDEAAIAEAREELEALRSERGLPVPHERPDFEGFRELIESGDTDAFAEMRARRQQMMQENRDRPNAFSGR